MVMFNLFKKKKNQEAQVQESTRFNATCYVCGHIFDSYTGTSRGMIYDWGGEPETFWFCRLHIPNWDYAGEGKEMCRMHLASQNECVEKKCKLEHYTYYKSVLYFYKKTEDEKVEPEYLGK